MLRRGDHQASERLERALSGGPLPHDEDTRRLLAAAGALAPSNRRSPARIKATHDAMMRAFERTLTPLEVRDDSGTDDGLEEPELHRREITLPGGGRLVVSDLEEITPERLEEAAERFSAILSSRSKGRA
jgi:AcrR family transcriptional regulator